MNKSKKKAKKEKKEKISKQEQVLPKPEGANSNREFTPANSASERIIPESKAKKVKNGDVQPLSTQIKATERSDTSENAKEMAGNQPGKPQQTIHPTALAVLDKINGNATARRALLRLVGEGCDQNTVIALVYEYCRGGSLTDRKSPLWLARNALKRWTKLFKRLRGDAAEIEATICELAEKGVMMLYYQEGHDPATVVTEFAKELEVVCKNLKPGLNPRSGRNEFLVYLCYLVKAATKEEHYAEIALLIAALKGTTIPVEPKAKAKAIAKAVDAVRNRLARYEKENESAAHLRTEAEDEVTQWQESRSEISADPSGR